jgi:hypothetical protein
MPVGRGERLGALEVIDSARAFFTRPYRIVVLDDTGDLSTWRSLARYPEVTVLRKWRRRGLPHLIQSLQGGYRYVLRSYRFDALLKIDTDALITGPGIDSDILAYLRANPEAGMVGSRSWREREDHEWRKRLESEPAVWGSLIERAEKHGYQCGECVLGGAYVLSRGCVEALDSHGYLGFKVSGTPIAEDVVFSLLTKAVGLDLHEFAGPAQPFALAWQGLPMAPSEILVRGKKVIHSVKSTPGDLPTRTVFAIHRRRHLATVSGVQADTLALARRTAQLRAWIRWRPIVARALRQQRTARARRLLWRCATITPAHPLLWIGLALSLLPAALLRSLLSLRGATARRFLL